MSHERALFWITVIGLIGCNVVSGHVAAMSVAAMAGASLVYLGLQPISDGEGEESRDSA